MHPLTDKDQWRKLTRNTAEELARLEALDLAALTNEEALARLRRLKPVERPWRQDPEWSGLIEQQAIFRRWSENARV